MKWFREWRQWVQWKRDQDEKRLEDAILDRLRQYEPGVDVWSAQMIIAQVREHDRIIEASK